MNNTATVNDGAIRNPCDDLMQDILYALNRNGVKSYEVIPTLANIDFLGQIVEALEQTEIQ